MSAWLDSPNWPPWLAFWCVRPAPRVLSVAGPGDCLPYIELDFACCLLRYILSAAALPPEPKENPGARTVTGDRSRL